MAQNYPKRIELQEGIDLLLSHTERMGREKGWQSNEGLRQDFGPAGYGQKKISLPLTALPMTAMLSALRMLQVQDMTRR